MLAQCVNTQESFNLFDKSTPIEKQKEKPKNVLMNEKTIEHFITGFITLLDKTRVELNEHKEQKPLGNKRKTDIESIERRAEEVFPNDGDENTPLFRQAFIDGAVDYLDCGCKPAEWSEEDEKMLDRIITTLSLPPVYDNKACEKMVGWLKSLRPQPHWKPSEEQMEILSYVMESRDDHCGDVLCSLYNALKKL